MRIKQLLIAVGIGTMLAACSSDDTTLSLKKDRTIHINAGISGSLVKTRAVEDDATLQNTQFYENEAAMFYFWKENTMEFINTVNSDLSYSIKSGSFDFCGTADGAVYPADGTAVDVFALYPFDYNNSATGTSVLTRDATTFFVAQNQSTDAGYRMSDLMYAFSAGNTIENDPVELTFNHCLTKIIVRLPDTEEFNNATVKMKNVQLDKTLNFSDRTKVTLSQPASPTKGEITLGTYTTGNPLSAIVVPQTINPVTTIFEITLADATTVYEYKSSSGCSFEPNNVYTFNLTSKAITSSNVTITQWSHMDDDENVTDDAIQKK